MKLTIQSTALLAAINRAKPAVASGMFATLLLSASSNRLTVTANNFDQAIAITADCASESDGAIVINATRLAEVVTQLGKCELSLELKLKKPQPDAVALVIRRGQSVISLAALNADEFAPMPTAKGAQTFSLPRAELRAVFLRLLPFASNEPSRYTLCGIFLNGDGNKIEAVSTNGRLMRITRIESPVKCEANIPATAAKMLAALCDGEDGAVQVSLAGNLVEAFADNWHFSSKLIDGNYPNYRQTIPSDSKPITGDRAALIEAVALVEIAAREAQKASTVKLEFARECFASSSAANSASIPLEGWTTNRGPLAIAFDPVFLRAGLRSFSSEEVGLQMLDPMSALKIEDASGIFVCMPMRIS